VAVAAVVAVLASCAGPSGVSSAPAATGGSAGGSPLAAAVAPGTDASPAPAAAAAGTAVLVGAGDVGWCGTRWAAETAKIVQGIAGTVIVPGDVAYPNGSTSDFARCYDPTWGAFKSRTRPAPGNHEYYTKGAAPYFAYFGSRAGTAGEGWYSYDAGTWHVIVLNSDCAYVGCGVGSSQEKWLKADLAAHPVACTIAYFHHPRFSSGPHGSDPRTDAFWRDLYAAGAELIVNGHDHDYERFAPQTPDGVADPAHGIRELVVGTGGGPLYPFIRRTANSQAKGLAFGVVKLTLMSNTYRWDFIPVAGATFHDSGTGTCH
jgi:hypothetical protein